MNTDCLLLATLGARKVETFLAKVVFNCPKAIYQAIFLLVSAEITFRDPHQGSRMGVVYFCALYEIFRYTFAVFCCLPTLKSFLQLALTFRENLKCVGIFVC